jgi:MerR family copper efflux transcriptional regulator
MPKSSFVARRDGRQRRRSMHGLSIGELAKAASVSIYTIRFYEKSGLLPPPSRRASGFRQYSELDVLQLQFVRQARSLGFSIDEIVELLAVEVEQSSDVVSHVIERNLETINRKIAQLMSWRDGLDEIRKNPAGQRLPRRFFQQ